MVLWFSYWNYGLLFLPLFSLSCFIFPVWHIHTNSQWSFTIVLSSASNSLGKNGCKSSLFSLKGKTLPTYFPLLIWITWVVLKFDVMMDPRLKPDPLSRLNLVCTLFNVYPIRKVVLVQTSSLLFYAKCIMLLACLVCFWTTLHFDDAFLLVIIWVIELMWWRHCLKSVR